MGVQGYPMLVSIYKGEGRILIIPVVDHIGGYSIDSSWFISMETMQDYAGIGENLFKALEFIKNSPVSRLTPKEREAEAAWKANSKYKSWVSFWKNNNFAHFKFFEDGHFQIYSIRRSERNGGYGECIKMIDLPSTASAEEIGKAVIDVFKAAEEYYQKKSEDASCAVKKLELLDGSTLTVKCPEEKHFNDYEDGHAAEIYQCYCYLPRMDAESTAEFFIGIAPELDCDLDIVNVRNSWEEIYGKADFFEMQNVDYGIFKFRIEMKNKSTHKISYILPQDEDLLLECGMDVHQPNRRKKLDEKLMELFKDFALSCKM